MKKLLILGATINQLPFIELAKNKGIFTITLDNIPSSICHRFSDEYVNLSTDDKDEVLKYAKSINVDGIVTCASDLALPTAAYVCNKLNLPSENFETIMKTINKKNFRKFQGINNLLCPKYFTFTSSEEVKSFIRNITGNWIIKPVDSSGSKGISLLNNVNINSIDLNIDNAFLFSKSNTVIIEELIEGTNCSVDGFIQNKIVKHLFITNKSLSPSPFFTPIAHTIPSRFSKKIQEKIKLKIEEVLHILNVDTSPFDFDIIVNDKGDIYIIEMSLRIGGNGIPKLIQYASGINLYDCVISFALGEEIPTIKPMMTEKAFGIFLITSHKNGRISSIAPISEMKNENVGQLLDIIYDVKVGDEVEKFTQGNHRIGHYIITQDSLDDLDVYSTKIKRMLQVVINSNHQ